MYCSSETPLVAPSGSPWKIGIAIASKHSLLPCWKVGDLGISWWPDAKISRLFLGLYGVISIVSDRPRGCNRDHDCAAQTEHHKNAPKLGLSLVGSPNI